MGFDAWLNSESYQSAAKAYDDKEYELITGLPGWITWEEFVPKFEKVLNDHNKNERLKNFKIKDFCYESKVLVEVELDGEPVEGVVTWANCD
jgi:parvulin-like peptidyl-prolyl isomerase